MATDMTKIHERIRKLWVLQHDKGASEGEKTNCGILIEKLLVQYNLRIEQVVPEAAPKQKQQKTSSSSSSNYWSYSQFDAEEFIRRMNEQQKAQKPEPDPYYTDPYADPYGNMSYNEFKDIFDKATRVNDTAKKAKEEAESKKWKERAKQAQDDEKKRKDKWRKDVFGMEWQTMYDAFVDGSEETRIASLSDTDKIQVCKWWNSGKSIGEMADKLNAYDSVIHDTLIELGFQVEKPAN